MPRLNCTYADFVDILRNQGFALFRHGASSHQRWRKATDIEVRYVDIAAHSWTAQIPKGTLNSMIRQSGLQKGLFKK